MLFLVATNVVASRPPERRPTGTPHARAKIHINISKIKSTNQKLDQQIKGQSNRKNVRLPYQMLDKQIKCRTNRLNARSADQKFDKQINK